MAYKTDKYLNSLKMLHDYCYSNSYKGYSLYDSQNSIIPFHYLGHRFSFFINQIIKRSPINIRPLIGIKKEYNPKGIGLFLYSYTLIKKNDLLLIHGIDDIIMSLFNWLAKNNNKNYKGIGWGYNYDWPKSDGLVVPKNTPNSVVTAFNARAIYEYYKLSNDLSAKEILLGNKDYILNNTFITETNDGICFSYTPLTRDITINASLLAAEILAISDKIQGKHEFRDTIERVLNFTISKQNEDGSWYYSFDIVSGKPKKQIDFHQGYVLDSILNLCLLAELDITKFTPNILKGLQFYNESQFSNSGISFWRYPSKYPVDIHNQSQGIITFSKFSVLNEKYLFFSEKVTDWTIQNMKNKKQGYFYYQKWPLLMNKVSYMRWNNAWMMLALTKLLSIKNKSDMWL